MDFYNYIKEADFLKNYIFAVFLPLVLFYSVYLYLDSEVIFTITDEDNIYEWLTVLFFLGSSWYSFRLYRSTRNVFFILFTVAFFFAAGEEISWGQRLLGFTPPESILERNVQEELTIHNLEIFNTHTHEGQTKTGLSRLLEINFLFRLATLMYGIILPILVFHSDIVKGLTKRLKIPVPPVSLGIFFLVNWMVFRTLHSSWTAYPGGGTEIFESMAAYILLIVIVFFYKEKDKVDYIGIDIKDSFGRVITGKRLAKLRRQESMK